MRIVGMIPSRMASSRLPGKPLLDLCGKPMVQHVWEAAMRASRLDQVVVATPDREIVRAVQAFGGDAVLTADTHRSGTDRLAEAVVQLDADAVVNIQGDEPLVLPGLIDAVAAPLAEPLVQMVSLCCPAQEHEINEPSVVKAVVGSDGYALYFSRAPIPYVRDASAGVIPRKHIGIYGYTREVLLRLASLAPSPLEITESLEQLRALENGIRIRMVDVDAAPVGVDTADDLARARAMLEQQG